MRRNRRHRGGVDGELATDGQASILLAETAGVQQQFHGKFAPRPKETVADIIQQNTEELNRLIRPPRALPKVAENDRGGRTDVNVKELLAPLKISTPTTVRWNVRGVGLASNPPSTRKTGQAPTAFTFQPGRSIEDADEPTESRVETEHMGALSRSVSYEKPAHEGSIEVKVGSPVTSPRPLVPALPISEIKSPKSPVKPKLSPAVFSDRTGDILRERKAIVALEGWGSRALRRVKDFFGVGNSPNFITDTLLLGNREDAQSYTKLIELGVSHIINATQQLPNYHPDHFIYCNVPILDAESEDIRPHLAKAIGFIDDAVKAGTRCFVHCIAGVSRSPALIIAYLVTRLKMPLRDALRLVIHKRPIALPNEAFRLQLAYVELDELGESSVATFDDKEWSFPAWNASKGTIAARQSHKKKHNSKKKKKGHSKVADSSMASGTK